MNTPGIYSIKRKSTGKRYIGQAVNIEGRWLFHCNECYRKEAEIDKDIHNLGKDAFEFEIIEEMDPFDFDLKQKLNDREIYWIKYYNTYEGFGYNHTAGDQEIYKNEPIYMIDPETFNVVKEFYNTRQAVCFLNESELDTHWLATAAMTKEKQFGYYWCYKKDFKFSDWPIKGSLLKVYMYDRKKRKKIKSFDNMYKAAEYVYSKGLIGDWLTTEGDLVKEIKLECKENDRSLVKGQMGNVIGYYYRGYDYYLFSYNQYLNLNKEELVFYNDHNCHNSLEFWDDEPDSIIPSEYKEVID